MFGKTSCLEEKVFSSLGCIAADDTVLQYSMLHQYCVIRKKYRHFLYFLVFIFKPKQQQKRTPLLKDGCKNKFIYVNCIFVDMYLNKTVISSYFVFKLNDSCQQWHISMYYTHCFF